MTNYIFNHLLEITNTKLVTNAFHTLVAIKTAFCAFNLSFFFRGSTESIKLVFGERERERGGGERERMSYNCSFPCYVFCLVSSFIQFKMQQWQYTMTTRKFYIRTSYLNLLDDNNNKYIHYDLQYFSCNKIYQKTYHKTSQIKVFSLVTLH